MDQSTLVGDPVYDGRRFVERFAADGNPLQAAFWAKSAEYGDWTLYLVTDLPDRLGPAAAYKAVHASLQKLGESGISGSEIRVTGPNDPMAKDVLKIMANHPGTAASRFAGKTLGSLDIDQAYIYPPQVFTFTRANPMTTDEISREIVRLMNLNNGALQPARVTLKDGTAFHGVPFALEVGAQRAMVVRFIADGEVAPRVLRLDEISSIG